MYNAWKYKDILEQISKRLICDMSETKSLIRMEAGSFYGAEYNVPPCCYLGGSLIYNSGTMLHNRCQWKVKL